MKITPNSFEWSAGDLSLAAKSVEKFSPILSDFSPFSQNSHKFRHSSNSFAMQGIQGKKRWRISLFEVLQHLLTSYIFWYFPSTSE